VAKIKAGVVILRIICANVTFAAGALIQAQKRLPIRTKIY
jgi:ribosomal protein L16/L10AE